MFREFLIVACFAGSLSAADAYIDPAYSASYTLTNLGSVEGVETNYGGITFLNNSTLLLGSRANNQTATIQRVAVNRGVGGHIVSFGAVSPYASAPFIDGGLAFGPEGVLFATGYSNNTILQFRPGSTSPDKTISLPGGIGESVGTLQFVPNGYPGAGNFVIGAYGDDKWYTATLTPDGAGTFDITGLTLRENAEGGPEGLIYVPLGSPLFGSPSVLVSEYRANLVRAYTLDAFGVPVTSTKATFVNGISGAEGATIDPVTGDFLFSTFGSGNQIIQVRGFSAPVSDTPEPATFVLAGVILAGITYRRRFTGK